MDEARKSLKRVSTYAREKGISTTAVYTQIKKGIVDSESIDGVTFIKGADDGIKK